MSKRKKTEMYGSLPQIEEPEANIDSMENELKMTQFDDICTSIFVDEFLKITTSKFTSTRSNIDVSLVIKDFIQSNNLNQAIDSLALLNIPFNPLLQNYLGMFHRQAGFEIAITHQYNIQNQATIIATRVWLKGTIIKYCTASTIPMKNDCLHKDFSIIYSTKEKVYNLLLGPLRFANHDCIPNTQFMHNSKGLNLLVIKDIQINEEILVDYGNDYFGPNNIDCLCKSCQIYSKNGFNDDTKPEYSKLVLLETRKKTVKQVDFKTILKTRIVQYDDCSFCLNKIDQDQQVLNEKCCSRCFRHYFFYNFTWPNHGLASEIEVESDHLQEIDQEKGQEIIPHIPLIKPLISTIVPGKPPIDLSLPNFVFVNAYGERNIWYVAVTIPSKYLHLEKSLSNLGKSILPDEASVVYLSVPSRYFNLTQSGNIPIVDMRIYNNETFKYFQGIEENLDNFYEILVMKQLQARQKFRLKWRPFKTLFETLYKEFPSVFSD